MIFIPLINTGLAIMSISELNSLKTLYEINFVFTRIDCGINLKLDIILIASIF